MEMRVASYRGRLMEAGVSYGDEGGILRGTNPCPGDSVNAAAKHPGTRYLMPVAPLVVRPTRNTSHRHFPLRTTAGQRLWLKTPGPYAGPEGPGAGPGSHGGLASEVRGGSRKGPAEEGSPRSRGA